MVDHIRILLLNPTGLPEYRHVTDSAADAVMGLFGVRGDDSAADSSTVSRLLPLVYADELVHFRRFFDHRVTPAAPMSIYRTAATELSPAGLHKSILGVDGWWVVTRLFMSDDPIVFNNLQEMREAATSYDAPYALGAVLLACAYRRLILQGV